MKKLRFWRVHFRSAWTEFQGFKHHTNYCNQDTMVTKSDWRWKLVSIRQKRCKCVDLYGSRRHWRNERKWVVNLNKSHKSGKLKSSHLAKKNNQSSSQNTMMYIFQWRTSLLVDIHGLISSLRYKNDWNFEQ